MLLIGTPASTRPFRVITTLTRTRYSHEAEAIVWTTERWSDDSNGKDGNSYIGTVIKHTLHYLDLLYDVIYNKLHATDLQQIQCLQPIHSKLHDKSTN